MYTSPPRPWRDMTTAVFRQLSFFLFIRASFSFFCFFSFVFPSAFSRQKCFITASSLRFSCCASTFSCCFQTDLLSFFLSRERTHSFTADSPFLSVESPVGCFDVAPQSIVSTGALPSAQIRTASSYNLSAGSPKLRFSLRFALRRTHTFHSGGLGGKKKKSHGS